MKPSFSGVYDEIIRREPKIWFCRVQVPQTAAGFSGDVRV